MDEVFRALAYASRRRLLDALFEMNGQTLGELCEYLAMSRQAVTKHLRVLEEANLITTVRRGREKLHYLNPVPINDIADRWMGKYERGRVQALADLKSALEQEHMGETRFVYTIYIKTTPEELWRALTDPAFTRRYWGVSFDTDWQPGSAMTWEQGGVTIADAAQVVLETEPHRRLSYTWHTFTREFADWAGLDEDTFTRSASERRSKVTFDIEAAGAMVKLTVTHDDFEPGSAILDGISEGWPVILSNLKTLLESGEPMLAG